MIAERLRRFSTAAWTAALAGLLATGPVRADAIDDQVIAAFAVLSETACFGGPEPIGVPEIFDLTYRQDFEGATDVEYRLYKFYCGSGAYNRFDMFLSWDEYNGVQPVAFAIPTFEPDCRMGGFENLDCITVNAIPITGMTTENQLVNATFDLATRTVTENACWRGLCDASSIGTWQFRNGQFVLVTFEVDPTYNGEIDLVRIVDYPVDTGPARPTKRAN
ncbi:MAG: hypothetical protein KIT43_13635 [Bauldia sp.]|nr:hypothetical protein [Bauldia sp.]